MPVTLTTLALNPKFVDEFTGAGGGGIDFLLGSIGDKIVADIEFDIYWGSYNIPCTFDAATKTITRTDIYTTYGGTPVNPRPASFLLDEFKPGDTFTIANTGLNNGSYTISTVSDYVITTVEALMNESAVNTYLYGDTPITGVDYFFNIIENGTGETYKSTVDNLNSNKFNCGSCAIPMASTPMDAVGSSLGWLIGTAYINDVGFVSHVQSFKITHTFIITPLFINRWLQNIQTGATPKGFYENGESLKYICKIGCKYLNISATYDHESTFADTMKKGTVGFYNEYLNGLPANYTLKSISFTDVISGLPVTELQYGRETDVDIRLTSVDSVFSLDTRVVLNQLYCPLTTSDYINTGAETLQDNFRFDRVKLITTTAAVNGEQFGTDNQCITQAQSVRISASELQITYRCSLATSYTTFIAGKPAKNRNYLIFATPQDIAVSKTIDTDRNAVICHTANYTTDNTDATLFQIVGSDIYFHQYPDELMNDYTDFKAFSADFCLVRGIFQTKSKLDVLLKSLTFKIEAVKAYNDNIVLEQYDFNLTAYPLDLNLIQQIDIEQPTNFKVKVGSIYDNIILQRVPALDSGNYVAYYFEYPFRVRYETWVQLVSAAYPNTGTQDWAFYEDNGWAIQFNIYASMFDNVTQWQTDFIHTSNLSFNAFDELSTDKSTCQITTWNVNQTENFDGNIRGDEDTMILATFTGDFSSLPAGATGYIGQIVLDSPEIGGVYYAQTAASDTTPITGGIWKAAATLTKVNNNIITVTAIIDHTKLNDLSAGIYPLNYLCFSARLDYLYDVDLILQENLDPILQENIQGLQQE